MNLGVKLKIEFLFYIKMSLELVPIDIIKWLYTFLDKRSIVNLSSINHKFRELIGKDLIKCFKKNHITCYEHSRNIYLCEYEYICEKFIQKLVHKIIVTKVYIQKISYGINVKKPINEFYKYEFCFIESVYGIIMDPKIRQVLWTGDRGITATNRDETRIRSDLIINKLMKITDPNLVNEAYKHEYYLSNIEKCHEFMMSILFEKL